MAKTEKNEAAPKAAELATSQGSPDPQESAPKKVRLRYMLDEKEPAREVQIGLTVISLPNAAEQRQGFDLEAGSARLLRTNRNGYKLDKSTRK